MGLGELFQPRTPLERDRSEFVLIVAIAALLSLGAAVGVAWRAGALGKVLRSTGAILGSSAGGGGTEVTANAPFTGGPRASLRRSRSRSL